MNQLRNNNSRLVSALALLVLPVAAVAAGGAFELAAVPVALLLGLGLGALAAYVESALRLVESDRPKSAGGLAPAGC